MNRSMSKLKSLAAAFACMASLSPLTGCDVHEFPEVTTPVETKAPLTITLDFDTEMPLYKEVLQAKPRSGNTANAYDTRHMISVHRLFANGNYDRTADTIVTFSCDDVNNLNCSREITLPQGNYNLFVWTDFVNEGSLADKFYKTSDFAEIILSDRNNHTGCCDYRDGFRGLQQASINVDSYNEVTVEMKRPMAKFKFISTDYADFVETMLKMEALKKNKELTSSSDAPADSRTINPDDYTVIFRYSGFMPCSYNMFTDKPADSWTGVSFNGALIPTGPNEVELGFDYVFVNGSEATVAVRLEVYNKDNELVASSNTINVPLKRSRLTIIKGSFLTSIAGGGVGINPSFDGQYNIEII